MSALLQLGSVTISVGAERALGQPGGLPDISRGLSASDTPGMPSKTNRTPEGCQNLSRDHLLKSLAGVSLLLRQQIQQTAPSRTQTQKQLIVTIA